MLRLVNLRGLFKKKIGVFQVKTHLSQLLREIESSGEEIAITVHGRVIVVLSPVPQENQVKQAILSIHKNRKGIKLGKDLSLKSLIEEGRK